MRCSEFCSILTPRYSFSDGVGIVSLRDILRHDLNEKDDEVRMNARLHPLRPGRVDLSRAFDFRCVFATVHCSVTPYGPKVTLLSVT